MSKRTIYLIQLFFLSLIFGAFPNLSQATTIPSAYDIMKPPDFSGVELSPNGRYIAFIRIKTKKYCLDRYGSVIKSEEANCKDQNKSYRTVNQISIFDLNVSRIITNIPLPENFYVNWLEWASNDRLLAALVRPTTVGEKGGYILGGSRIVSLPLKGGKPVALFADQKRFARQNRHLVKISNMLRDDPEHIIMPASKNGALDLWKVNVLTGHSERIAKGKSKTFYWFTDPKGEPVLRFDCLVSSCRKINVLAFNQEANKWKKIKTFKIKPDEGEDDYSFWPIASAEKEGQYYVMSNEDTDDFRSIKLYDIKTETYIKTVFKQPNIDVGGALLDLQTGNYSGAWFYDDRLNYAFNNTKLQKHYKGLNTYFGNQENVKLFGFDAKRTKAVIHVTSPQNPGEYYVYDIENKNVTRIFGSYSHLDERLATETEVLHIPVRDGTNITAYYTYPKAKKFAKAPLLVMPHGGPERRDYYDYDRTVQYFATHGYQILQVNFRGSSGFGRKFAEAGYGEWGGKMQNDVTDSVKYLYNQNLASADNACIVGYSYGGYVALYAGAMTPELFKCVVSGGGVSDILADLKQTRKYYGKNSESYEYWLKSMGNPKTEKDKLSANSPVNFATNFKTPVLLIHGEHDGIVDISQSLKMQKELIKVGADVEFLKLKNVGHSGWDLENKILYLETVEDFVSRHLTK